MIPEWAFIPLLVLLAWLGKFVFGKRWVRAWATGVSPLEMRRELHSIQKKGRFAVARSNPLPEGASCSVPVVLYPNGVGATFTLFRLPEFHWKVEFDPGIPQDENGHPIFSEPLVRADKAIFLLDRGLGINTLRPEESWRLSSYVEDESLRRGLPGLPWDEGATDFLRSLATAMNGPRRARRGGVLRDLNQSL